MTALATFRAVLFGGREVDGRRWTALVAGAFLVSLAWFALVNTRGTTPVHRALWADGYVALLVAVVAWQAYAVRGLLLSWLVGFAAVAALVLNYGGIGVTGAPPGGLALLALAAAAGVAGALTAGTGGFVIGRALARLVA